MLHDEQLQKLIDKYFPILQVELEKRIDRQMVDNSVCIDETNDPNDGIIVWTRPFKNYEEYGLHLEGKWTFNPQTGRAKTNYRLGYFELSNSFFSYRRVSSKGKLYTDFPKRAIDQSIDKESIYKEINKIKVTSVNRILQRFEIEAKYRTVYSSVDAFLVIKDKTSNDHDPYLKEPGSKRKRLGVSNGTMALKVCQYVLNQERKKRKVNG